MHSNIILSSFALLLDFKVYWTWLLDLPPYVDFKDDNRIYFHKYEFCQSEWQGIRTLHQKLLEQRFNGRSIVHIANILKHEMPWMGRISTNEKLSITDIFGNDRKYDGPLLEYR